MSGQSMSPVIVDLTQARSHQQILASSPHSFHRHEINQCVIEFHQHPAHEIEHCSVIQSGIVLNLGGAYHAEQWIDGQFYRNRFDPGDCIVFPAKISHRVIWDRAIEFLIIGVDDALIQETASALNDTEKTHLSASQFSDLIPQDRLSDPLIHQVGLALKTEFCSYGSLNSLYTESMINTLIVHLLRRYSSQSNPSPALAEGLPPFKLKQVLEYIHAHLAEDMQLSQLAAIAQLSPNHFASSFKKAIGVPPYQYIIQQRLEQAQKLLKTTSMSITEISMQVGFASQSHFTTHFRKHLSITPKKYREMMFGRS
jgi:AraC family transcriptional regulator